MFAHFTTLQKFIGHQTILWNCHCINELWVFLAFLSIDKYKISMYEPFSFGLVSPSTDVEVNKMEFSQILELFFRWQYQSPKMERFHVIMMIHFRQLHHEQADDIPFDRQFHYQIQWRLLAKYWKIWLKHFKILPKNDWRVFWYWKIFISFDHFIAGCVIVSQLPMF